MQRGEGRSTSAVEAALEAALSLLPGLAFAFDREGKILASNARARTPDPSMPERARAFLDQTPLEGARIARMGEATVVLLTDGRASTEHTLDVALVEAKKRWSLTPKQTEILGHLVGGASNKEIASLLDCSLSNVEAHLTALLRRAGCGSRGELIAAFWRPRP